MKKEIEKRNFSVKSNRLVSFFIKQKIYSINLKLKKSTREIKAITKIEKQTDKINK